MNHQINKAFLTSIDFKTRMQILTAISLHYGITQAQAFEEVTDEGAEHLLDYLTGSVRTATSLLMKRHGITA